VIHGFVHKFIVSKLTQPQFYMYAKPWVGTVFASILWDAVVAHCIINQACVRGIGVGFCILNPIAPPSKKYEGPCTRVATNPCN
jgi:hypothetical protein